MIKSNTKVHYVSHSELQQLERHCDLLRATAVLNTLPGSNINITLIISNYECSLLSRSLFDVCGLSNHGGDWKSDLVLAVRNSIDGAWIDPWRDKPDVVVIDGISTLFHLRKSISLKGFKCCSCHLKIKLWKILISSTLIISFDSYLAITKIY